MRDTPIHYANIISRRMHLRLFLRLRVSLRLPASSYKMRVVAGLQTLNIYTLVNSLSASYCLRDIQPRTIKLKIPNLYRPSQTVITSFSKYQFLYAPNPTLPHAAISNPPFSPSPLRPHMPYLTKAGWQTGGFTSKICSSTTSTAHQLGRSLPERRRVGRAVRLS